MAAPTAPTATTIVQEGLKKAGLRTGTTKFTTLSTRGVDEWMEEIKNDIWERAKDLNILQTSSQVLLSKGDSLYPLPSDFSSLIDITLLSGETSGTAQAGASAAITLASGIGFSTDQIVGQNILLTGGTGSGQLGQCTAYNATTEVATVSDSWTTTPDSTTTYLIIDTEQVLNEEMIWDYNKELLPGTLGTPFQYTRIGTTSGVDNVRLYYTPDKAYGLKVDYYSDLTKADLTSTVLVTAYRRWRNCFLKGIKQRTLEDLNDDREIAALQEYDRELKQIDSREQTGSDVNNLQCKVVDRI